MAAQKKQGEAITLPALNVKAVQLTVIGDSPLIVHAWSRKAKEQILAKQMKKAGGKKEAKDPEKDYSECFYYTPDGAYGFPAVGFKSAMVGACRFLDGIPMTVARGALHVERETVPVTGEPRPREDMVRVGMGTADIRYRPEFPEWSADLIVRYNADVLSAEQVTNLLNLAGFSIGIGEWRPERNGQFGRFHVATEADR